ncbi:MAG: ABC transporter permease [Bifidobacteriaceae bacterium]|jgi:ABC-2 type transport system permease protein|nr:ABC transporter permease [Bifidobacteriaceae bacterium]
MSLARTAATARRVLAQLRHDPRSMALIVVVPCVVLGVVAWMFNATPMVIDQFGPMLLAVFPAFVMFLVTSVTMLRERTSGTLERLMTTPISKADFLVGYALAFALMAAVQAVVLTVWAHLVCGMDVAGSPAGVMAIAVLDAVLGSSLGLAASSVARTEFQAVQMLPVVIVPQLLVCGLLMPRDQLPTLLRWLSDAVPFTYALEATTDLTSGRGWSAAAPDAALVAGFVVLAAALGVATLRRRTP